MRLAIAAALALVVAGCTPTHSVNPQAQAPLPQVVLQDMVGDGALDLGGEVDHPMVLNLWATWCAPCRHELPAFDQVAAELAEDPRRIEVIGVNVGDAGPDAAELIAELGIDPANFRQVLDPAARIQRTLKIAGLPATVLVDARGAVLEIHHGALTAPELRNLIDTSIDE